MFNPEEYAIYLFPASIAINFGRLSSETDHDWDRDLADDVKGECEEKYGHVDFIKVEKESQVGWP